MKKPYSFFFLLHICVMFLCVRVHGQVITTFAGNGTGAYTGDGALATDASLYVPGYLATAPDGSIYISDYGNNCIRKVDGAGGITTIAGTGIAGYTGNGGAATLATLFRPSGIVTDTAGNIYFTDNGNFVVRKISAAGIITTVAGNNTMGYTGDGGAATAAQLMAPDGLAIDKAGNLYLPDGGAHCIRKVAASGVISTIAGTGTAGYTGDGGAATAAQINRPVDVAIDGLGNLYCTDQNNNVIRKIDTAGIISTIAGNGTMGYWGDNGPATAALLNKPAGIYATDSGQIFFADFFNHRVRQITTSGIITTVAGVGIGGYTGDGGPATAARLRLPNKLIQDNCGDYLIADRSNNRVRKITFANKPPVYINTQPDTLEVCQQGEAGLGTALAAYNAFSCQMLTWRVVVAPGNGTLVGLPTSALSAGDTLQPDAVQYTPDTGFAGIDSLVVAVNDGADTAYKTIYVVVRPLPVITAITGPDSLCAGDTAVFVNATSGGVWSNVNTGVATVSAGGVVTAIASGADTLVYMVSNAWCSAAVRLAYRVSVPEACINTVPVATGTNKQLAISLSPNPSTGAVSIHVASSALQAVKITVTDVLGRTIAERNTYTNASLMWQIQADAGVYTVKATTASGSVTVLLVIAK
jgi:sugar lactone lactonase YvrE